MTTDRPLLAAIEDDERPVDPIHALAGLAELRRRIRRRASWPWNLVSWAEGGRRRASILGPLSRMAVHAEARGPSIDPVAGAPTGEPGHALLRSYRIGGHGDIAIRLGGAGSDGSAKAVLAETIVDIAERSIRAALDGPDPTDLMAALAMTASMLDDDPDRFGWWMPTPFTPLTGHDGKRVPIDVPRRGSDLPHALTIQLSRNPHGRGFDVALSPLFVPAREARDVMAAMRQAPILAGLGTATVGMPPAA